MIYLDNSATTKPFPEVIQAMSTVMEKYYGNASSLHPLGAEAEKLLQRARETVARGVAVAPSSIIFTSGGTESNNLAIKGVAFAYQNRGKHLITTEVEHPSVSEVYQALQQDFGFRVTYLPVNRQGLVSVETLKKELRPDTILVSMIHVNNEVGSIQPLQEIGRLLKQHPKIIFHVDHVQGFGKLPLSFDESGIDLASVSGHKIHAPKGTGFLYKREGIRLAPLFHGGGQQFGLRPGTENVAGYVALAKAVRMVADLMEKKRDHFLRLKNKTLQCLEKLEGVKVNSGIQAEEAAPHIINLSFLGMKPEVIVHALAERGIYVSTKSACSSKAHEPSKTLLAMGLSQERAESAIRISFSLENTLDEIEDFGRVLHTVIPPLQKIVKG